MIPFINLPAQYRSIQPDIDAAVHRVLESGRYTLGEEVVLFEQEFAAYCGVHHSVAVNSGTSALHLALLTAGVGPGDEVITVPFTFVATVAAIVYTGAKPVFVDIDPATFTMDVECIEAAITPRTKVLLPVHLYGQSADMEPIREIAARQRLTVIEDAAQAHGAEYYGHRVGSLGDLACFSFYPGKNLGAYGEGGCITTDNADYARTLRMLRDWGCERRYHHELHAFNYRMDALQAAVLRIKLRHLEAWTETRRSHAALYQRLLSDSPVHVAAVPPNRRHVYHVFAVRTEHRDDLQRQLKSVNIETGIHYPVPVHLQKAYAGLGYRLGGFPEAERAAAEELSLPLYPEMTTTEIETVSAAVHAAIATKPAECQTVGCP